MATFFNTIITFTDPSGGVLTTASAGGCGFRNRLSTAYAAQVTAKKQQLTSKQTYGTTRVDVFIKGVGLGREAAVRCLQGLNIAVESIADVTDCATRWRFDHERQENLMARDTQSIVKMSRREGYALHPKAHKALAKRTALPGQNNTGRGYRAKASQYSLQLREKQK